MCTKDINLIKGKYIDTRILISDEDQKLLESKLNEFENKFLDFLEDALPPFDFTKNRSSNWDFISIKLCRLEGLVTEKFNKRKKEYYRGCIPPLLNDDYKQN